MMNKIKEKNGFTLSEMLMTVLIICLVVLLLGGGVYVIKNAYDKVTAKAEAQTIASTAITKLTDEFRYATGISENDGHWEFMSGNMNCVIWFENADSASGKRGILICRRHGGTGEKIQLLTNETMAEGLTPRITYEYDEDAGVFNATVRIKYKDKENFVKQELNVKPVND
ncbi:MAG: prepilin-type N-terminal cleavage/methylation domain-containing protein [Clostridiales bacterium]|nr:prepilin-type N-terminal cleavage/methylation domain-containing protein [Clostridiales bacterium]